VPAIEGRVRELLEAPNFCHVGTLDVSGRISVVPVWVHTDGEHVLVNTAEGRGWPRNLDRDPRVTCTVTNHDQPYEYATIHGRVTERRHEGADAHIDFLAKKYLGVDAYPGRNAAETRVIIVITPERVRHWG